KVKTYLNYINGEWKTSSSGKTGNSINPANVEEIVGQYQMSTENDFSKAVKSANNVKEEWRKTTGNVRGDLLMRTATIIEERLDDIAETLTREMGKTLPEALGETARGVAI